MGQKLCQNEKDHKKYFIVKDVIHNIAKNIVVNAI